MISLTPTLSWEGGGGEGASGRCLLGVGCRPTAECRAGRGRPRTSQRLPGTACWHKSTATSTPRGRGSPLRSSTGSRVNTDVVTGSQSCGKCPQTWGSASSPPHRDRARVRGRQPAAALDGEHAAHVAFASFCDGGRSQRRPRAAHRNGPVPPTGSSRLVAL